VRAFKGKQKLFFLQCQKLNWICAPLDMPNVAFQFAAQKVEPGGVSSPPDERNNLLL
jgi:hypothetical protein